MNKRHVLYAILLSILFIGCEKFDLPRDNPLDNKNNTNMINGVSLKYAMHEVVYDNNKDGIVNRGETVYLSVQLKNNGMKTANGVIAVFRADNPHISNFHPDSPVSYNNIDVGYSGKGFSGDAPNYYSYTIKFKVSDSVSENTQIPVNIHISDQGGNIWKDQFSVIVK